MTEPSLSLKNAGKKYTKFEDQPLLVTSALRFRTKTKREELWAVRGVNFEVMPGECVGVIGRNGAGKSTMLRMLAGVTSPSEGTIRVRGRVAPLVAVGVGFHPELTGRENVYVNGSILGLSRDEIDSKLESILAFAQIDHFVDTPVKFYSSGMYVRLGFAVAVHADPEILLVDEVLAVGDISFQVKCFEKMEEIAAAGTTVVVVSHNLLGIVRLCPRTAVLDGGELVFDGNTRDAISRYHELIAEGADVEEDLKTEHKVAQKGMARIEAFTLLDSKGQKRMQFDAGEEVTFVATVRFLEDVENPKSNFILHDAAGRLVYKEPASNMIAGRFKKGSTAESRVRLKLHLATGSYEARSMLFNEAVDKFYDIARPLMFHVLGRDFVGGLADLNASFEITSARNGKAPAAAAKAAVTPPPRPAGRAPRKPRPAPTSRTPGRAPGSARASRAKPPSRGPA